MKGVSNSDGIELSRKLKIMDTAHHRTTALLQIYNLDEAIAQKPRPMTSSEIVACGVPKSALERCSVWLRKEHHAHLNKHRHDFNLAMALWKDS